MGELIHQVDAFTAEVFAGNPAAVCLPAPSRDDAWMQALAAEVNLSETAFLAPAEDGWRLRWFTPAVEVDLCGHATLASAHVLWETGALAPKATARFHTRSGLLTARREDGLIWLDFPALPSTPGDAPAGLAEALGAPPVSVGLNRMDLVVELADEATVRGLRPDFARLKQLPVRGVAVTAASTDPAFAFVSRFFAPASGIEEDPVTGSAHCCLGPFWGARLGKTELTAYQASARGGIVHLRLRGERVELGGQAVTVLRGELG